MLLFEGAPNSIEMRQEILQNTLDRYDDLIDQGKTPEAAYRIAISGIGDINELIAEEEPPKPTPSINNQTVPVPTKESADTVLKQIFRAFAIFFYIICPIPLLVLSNISEIFGLENAILSVVGLCITLLLIAIATVLIILGKKKQGSRQERSDQAKAAQKESPIRRTIRNIVFIPCTVLYLIISFTTSAWHITWLLFPLAGATTGLIFAIMDLKEVNNNEK